MKNLFEMDDIPKDISKGDNEWFTPRYLIKAVKKVMGSIELDPASCEEANEIVQADIYYNKERDGLQQDWHARTLFVNPPYGLLPASGGSNWQGKSAMHAWISKLISEYKQGNVAQAILLTKSDPKQIWFQMLWDYPLCFVNNRVYFNRPNAKPERHYFGTCLAYFGQNEDLFVKFFTEFGPVITPDGVHRRPALAPKPTLWNYMEGVS